jgi:hypothetical protein
VAGRCMDINKTATGLERTVAEKLRITGRSVGALRQGKQGTTAFNSDVYTCQCDDHNLVHQVRYSFP